MENGCIYVPYWGKCGDETVTNNPPLCEEHLGKTCWCGKQAVEQCTVSARMVCGQPLCAEHECNSTGGGLTGNSNHNDRGRRQYLTWKR